MAKQGEMVVKWFAIMAIDDIFVYQGLFRKWTHPTG